MGYEQETDINELKSLLGEWLQYEPYPRLINRTCEVLGHPQASNSSVCHCQLASLHLKEKMKTVRVKWFG